MGVLTQKRYLQFETEGYLLTSGLIPEDISERAEKAMWRLMEMAPNAPATCEHKPDLAAQFQPMRGLSVLKGIQDPNIMFCVTPEYLKATADLLGEESVHPPESSHMQNKVPVKTQWSLPRAHIDGLPKEHMHRTQDRIASQVWFFSTTSITKGVEQRCFHDLIVRSWTLRNLMLKNTNILSN